MILTISIALACVAIALWLLAKDSDVCSDSGCPVCNDSWNFRPGGMNWMTPCVDEAIREGRILSSADCARPICFGSKPSAQSRAENDCDRCPYDASCSAYNAVRYDMSARGTGLYYMTPTGMKHVAVEQLYEQGASEDYIDKVKTDLCGVFGRVMP